MTNETAATLPGLELHAPAVSGYVSPMRTAVEKTLEALGEANLLQPMHAALAQQALMLADAMGRAATSPKVYALAQVSAELLKVLEALPKPAEAAKLDMFQQLVQRLEDAA